jgi:hypothetical protein
MCLRRHPSKITDRAVSPGHSDTSVIGLLSADRPRSPLLCGPSTQYCYEHRDPGGADLSATWGLARWAAHRSSTWLGERLGEPKYGEVSGTRSVSSTTNWVDADELPPNGFVEQGASSQSRTSQSLLEGSRVQRMRQTWRRATAGRR